MHSSATLGEKKFAYSGLASKYTGLDFISQYFNPTSQE